MLAALARYRSWLMATAFAIALYIAYDAGGDHRENAIKAAQLRAYEDALRRREEVWKHELALIEAYHAAEVERRKTTRAITKEVIRYVASPAAARECLDHDGVRIWNAANAGVAPGSDPIGAEDPVRVDDPANSERHGR